VAIGWTISGLLYNQNIIMNKYTRLGKNTITVFIGNAGAKLIGLLMLPFPHDERDVVLPLYK
jgi:hypothetical protein